MQSKTPTSGTWKAILLALLVPILVYAYSAGPPDAHTGGFGEPTCTECHLRSTGFSGRVTINVASGSTPVTSYASGATYTVTVTDFDTDQRRWGFQLSARKQDATQAGTLKPTDGNTQIANPAVSGTLTNPRVQYIEHTLAGTRNGTRDTGNGVSFVFSWTAPDASAGPVVFNAAGNAANGSLDNTGDHIYTTSLTLPPEAAGPPPPVVSGILNNGSFVSGSSSIAPGTIVAIFGQNMTDGTSCAFPGCGPTFDSNGVVNTTMTGTQVLVNGTPSSMFNTTPGQLVAVLPNNITGPTASVVVSVGGVASAPLAFSVSPLAPGIFTLNNQGTGQGAIQINNTALVAAPTSSGSRPAHPGEFVVVYCTGLGAVANPPGDGKVAGNSSTTTTPVLVTIGGIAVPASDIPFAGLAPGFVGLYQVNVKVPTAAPTNDALPLVLSIGGVQANPVTLAVGP